MYKKELRYYFSTPIAYIVIGLYLLTVSLFLWVIPGEWNIRDSGYAQVDGLFNLSSWLFILLCPSLTMRLFAEERQTGTWSMLRSKPIALWKIVVGKYMAAWTLVVLSQIPCIIHYFIVYNLAQPVGNVDSGAFFGSFLGLMFLSAAFCAIGTWSSTITKSQIVAFITGVVVCFLAFYGFDLLTSVLSHGKVSTMVQWLGLHRHYMSMSEGVIDMQDVVYFISVSLLFVSLSMHVMNRKRIE